MYNMVIVKIFFKIYRWNCNVYVCIYCLMICNNYLFVCWVYLYVFFFMGGVFWWMMIKIRNMKIGYIIFNNNICWKNKFKVKLVFLLVIFFFENCYIELVLSLRIVFGWGCFVVFFFCKFYFVYLISLNV